MEEIHLQLLQSIASSSTWREYCAGRSQWRKAGTGLVLLLFVRVKSSLICDCRALFAAAARALPYTAYFRNCKSATRRPVGSAPPRPRRASRRMCMPAEAIAIARASMLLRRHPSRRRLATVLLLLLDWPPRCHGVAAQLLHTSLEDEQAGTRGDSAGARSSNASCTADGVFNYTKDVNNQSMFFLHGSEDVWIHVAEQNRLIRFYRVNSVGWTGKIFMDYDHSLVLKGEFREQNRYGCAQREICIYRRLGEHSFKWTPRILCANEGHGILLMTYAGEAVDSKNLPGNYRAQGEQILRDLDSVGIRHGDIVKSNGTMMHQLRTRNAQTNAYFYGSHMEVRVHSGSLVIYDYSWATVNGSYMCNPSIPSHVSHLFVPQNDRVMLYFLDMLNSKRLQDESAHGLAHDAELRLVILWNPTHPAASVAYREALANFSVLGVRLHPAYDRARSRQTALNRLDQATRRGASLDAGTQFKRGSVPFVLLFIRLSKEEYSACRGGASVRGQRLCPNTDAYKNAMRLNHGLEVHATESVEELAALDIDYAAARSAEQPHWNSSRSLLQALNASGTQYVIARNFECAGLLGQLPCQLDELDLLADDCVRVAYAFDPVLGRRPPQSLGAILTPSKVNEHASIGARDVRVDVHCPGSDYIDERWLLAALAHREMHESGGFYVMQVRSTPLAHSASTCAAMSAKRCRT